MLQTHPNVDKSKFNQQSMIAMKQEGRPFPVNQDVGVLKWRLQTTDEGLMPLSSKSISYFWSKCVSLHSKDCTAKYVKQLSPRLSK